MRTKIRWWVPLVGIVLAWLGAFFPACLAAQELNAKQEMLTRYTTCYAEVMQLPPTWKIKIGFEAVSPGYTEYGATTEVRAQYFEATVTYRVGQDAKATDSELRALVVHELFHIHLEQLWELAARTANQWAERLNEQTATLAARWPLWQALCK